MIKDFVQIRGGFVKAVKVRDDFFDAQMNKRKLESYFPNPPARDALYGISRGLHPTSKERAHIISGTYGSGKSHFALVLANYASRNTGSKEFEPLFNRLRERDAAKATEIFNIRNVDKPYLLVLLEGYDADGIEHALLSGLREALRRGGIPDDRLRTMYKCALERIDDWKKNKPDFYKQLVTTVSKSMDFDLFLNNLANFKENSLSIFKDVHTTITTSSFEPLYRMDAVEAYREICQEVCKKGHKGIFIIWDQFNDHLYSISPEKLGRDANKIRDFAEFIERGGEEHQVHLVLVSHRAFKDYLQDIGLAKETLEIWGTVQGRFKQWPLTAIEDAEELISYAVTKAPGSEKWDRVRKELERNSRLKDFMIEYNIFPGKSEQWIQETALLGCYPLHPIAAYCLPRISEAVAQQEYRTMFTFLESSEKGGLTKFIKENKPFTLDGKINFYEVAMLFDFFEDDIRNGSETSRIIRNYNTALQKLVDPRDRQSQALLKTMCALSVIKTKFATIPLMRTPEHLSVMLGTPDSELATLLSSLHQRDVLWQKHNGEFDFRGTETPVNLENDLRKSKTELVWDNPIHILRIRNPPQDIVAEEYERQNRMERRLIGEYVTPETLSNLSRYENQVMTNYEDGYVLYVIAENKADIETARKYAVNIRNQQIVISIPRDPIEIYETLRNMEAIRRLKEKPPYSREEEEPYAMLVEKEEGENKTLQNALAVFTRPAEVDLFWRGKTVDTFGLKSLSAVASNVMVTVFPKTPVVFHRKMANIREQDQRANRIELNTAILDITKDEISYVSKGRVPAEKTILEQTLGNLDMLTSHTEGNFTFYKLKEPSGGNMKEIWDLIGSCLKKTSCTIGELIHRLRSPPYGISPRVVEILLSAFFHFNRPCFEIRTKKSKHAEWEHREFDGKTINDVVTWDADRVLVEYTPDPPHGERCRRMILESILSGKQLPTHVDADEVGGKLLEWYQSLPKVARKACEFTEQTRMFNSLMDTISAAPEKDMRKLVSEMLPQSLGVMKPFALWDESDIGSFKKALETAVREFSVQPQILREKIKQVLRRVFETRGDMEEQIFGAIGKWREGVPPAVKEFPKLSPHARTLLKYTDISRDTSIDKTFMLGLPLEMGLDSCMDWTEIEMKLKNYEKTMAEAKKEIDQLPRYIKTGRITEKASISTRGTQLEETLRRDIKNSRAARDEIRLILERLLEEWK